MSVAAKKLTWDDIKDCPESHGRTEIVDGDLVTAPCPASRHQIICSGNYVLLDRSGMGDRVLRPVLPGLDLDPGPLFDYARTGALN